VIDVVLARHGETEWSRTGRHTGTTDVPLTDHGRAQAAALAGRLAPLGPFGLVLTSPLARAADTCALAGFGSVAEVDDDLREWDYGDDEGLTTPEIRERVPGWTVWTHGPTNGEAAASVAARVDRVIARARSVAGGPVLLFAHGHLLRVLAARWLGLTPAEGRLFVLDPATVSVLGWERDTPALRSWNQR
jgi:probable phosphoglycerate mutase